jgi:peptide-methionine (S)-S-oxide reductase
MEAIEVDYDPSKVSYRELLDVFWSSHDPLRKAYRRQYASAIFFRTPEEKDAAEATAASFARGESRPTTEIVPFERFTLAEDYHQKYRLRGVAWLDGILKLAYPDLRDYVGSTAATRLNAWLDGEGSPTEAEIADLGFDAEETRSLRSLLRL